MRCSDKTGLKLLIKLAAFQASGMADT